MAMLSGTRGRAQALQQSSSGCLRVEANREICSSDLNPLFFSGLGVPSSTAATSPHHCLAAEHWVFQVCTSLVPPPPVVVSLCAALLIISSPLTFLFSPKTGSVCLISG